MAEPACQHSYTVEAIEGISDLLPLVGERGRTPWFYWESPAKHLAMLALGAAHVVDTEGPQRFELASGHALELLGRLQLRGAGAGAGAPRPRVVGGFAFSSSGSIGPLWREFPACRMVLPEELLILQADSCWRLIVTSCCRAEGSVLGSAPPAAKQACAMPDSRVVTGGIAPPVTGGTTLAVAGGGALPKALAFGSSSEEEDSSGVWLGRVQRVLALLGEGVVTKVVLSRQARDCCRSTSNVASLLGVLRDSRPSCVTYCACGGRTSFVGSSPECLVRLKGRCFETEALAGTSARGASPSDDARLARALAASGKNRREHRAVVEAIRAALDPLASWLELKQEPEILVLPEALHLRTPIRGELSRRASALAIAGRLHPTPSVCGTPQPVALSLLEAEEGGRGWYTGAVGWMDASGDGEYTVALRSALIDGAAVTLWAGAGIVAGSDPQAELEETEIKLAAMREALEAAA